MDWNLPNINVSTRPTTCFCVVESFVAFQERAMEEAKGDKMHARVEQWEESGDAQCRLALENLHRQQLLALRKKEEKAIRTAEKAADRRLRQVEEEMGPAERQSLR